MVPKLHPTQMHKRLISAPRNQDGFHSFSAAAASIKQYLNVLEITGIELQKKQLIIAGVRYAFVCI